MRGEFHWRLETQEHSGCKGNWISGLLKLKWTQGNLILDFLNGIWLTAVNPLSLKLWISSWTELQMTGVDFMCPKSTSFIMINWNFVISSLLSFHEAWLWHWHKVPFKSINEQSYGSGWCIKAWKWGVCEHTPNNFMACNLVSGVLDQSFLCWLYIIWELITEYINEILRFSDYSFGSILVIWKGVDSLI